MTLEALEDGLDLYSAGIRRYADDYAILFLEDSGCVPGDSIHFFDYIHFTDRGADAMAGRYFQHFVRTGLLERIAAENCSG